MNCSNELVRKHVAQRGWALALEQGLDGPRLVLYQGEDQIPLLSARQIPSTLEGKAVHNVQNAMFAAAIAAGLGVDVEDIRQGLRTFTTDFFQAPGRLNFYYEHPFRVLLDYAHNAHSMEAVARTVRELAVHGRRIGVIASPGDRRDEDVLALAAAAAPAFDLFVLKEDDDLRGRQPGEVGELLRKGLIHAGCPAERILPGVHNEEEGVLKALRLARAGDLVAIFGDKLTRVWELITSFKPGAAAPTEVSARRGERVLMEGRVA
jgi:cyanophycin synthetase